MDRRRVVRTAIGTCYAASLLRRWQAFRRGCAAPRVTQENRLRHFLETNSPTLYGTRHDYNRISNIEAFQSRVPIVSYEDIAGYVDKIADGQLGVLSSQPTIAMEPTSGTTSANKLIPYNAGLLEDFSAVTGPWMFDMFGRYPKLLTTQSYWSVSPAARRESTTKGGIRIGLQDDTEYFGPVARWGLKQLMAVPASVGDSTAMDEWQARTIAYLLEAQDLGCISIWSPTFLTVLMRAIESQLPTFLTGLSRRRRSQVERALEQPGTLLGDAIWPELQLISCWTDGQAQHFLGELQSFFSRATIEGKGLMATEGAVSIPFGGSASGDSVVAVTGHFLEFIDLQAQGRRPLTVEQLRVGGLYSPLLTTGNGFARYHLKDVVECTGFYRQTPRIRFVRKLDQVSDLAGEKLSVTDAERVAQVVTELLETAVPFVLLAPSVEPPGYCLYVESRGHSQAKLHSLSGAIERALMESAHYEYCRELGQLAPLQVVGVTNGWARYQTEQVQRGQRLGDIKPTVFDASLGWGAIFGDSERPS